MTQSRLLIQCYSCAGTLLVMTLWVMYDINFDGGIPFELTHMITLSLIALGSVVYFLIINHLIFFYDYKQHGPNKIASLFSKHKISVTILFLLLLAVGFLYPYITVSQYIQATLMLGFLWGSASQSFSLLCLLLCKCL